MILLFKVGQGKTFIKGIYILLEGHSMEDVVTENIIVEAKISDEFDLDAIAKELPDAKYNPDEFPGIEIRFPRASTIITKRGDFICSGAKDINEAKELLAKVVDILKEKGFKAKKKVKIEIKNLVISKDVKRWIDVKKLSLDLENVEYNPDKFPGAIYRGENGLTALIFDSGKIVCVGSADKKVLERFLKEVMEKIEGVG